MSYDILKKKTNRKELEIKGASKESKDFKDGDQSILSKEKYPLEGTERGLRFSSQHPYGSSQLPILVPGDPKPSSGP